MQKRRKIVILFLLLLLLGILVIHFYVPLFITEIKNPIIEHIRQKSSPLKWKSEIMGKKITWKAPDGITLSGYITYSTQPKVKGTIILLHGIRSQKEHFITMSDTLAHWGYHAVAIDVRAHGESGGKHCTFGVQEKKDISALIDLLNSEGHTNIGVWGQSLGGAIGLQAMGSDNRIQFGVIESTFSRFTTITHDYVSYHTGFDFAPFTDYLLYRAGKIAQFDPEDAAPYKYCKNINQPILIVHGDEDKRIDIRYGKENFAQIKSNQKQFITIKGAHHLNVWKKGGKKYKNTLRTFFDKVTK